MIVRQRQKEDNQEFYEKMKHGYAARKLEELKTIMAVRSEG
jgi:flagellar motility protein MotE (MotC chaperone)